MTNLTTYIKNELLCRGADLVGFGNLTELPPEVRQNLPIGISVAVKYPKEVIKGIHVLPTKEYYEQYNALNIKLDMLVTLGAEILQMQGYQAYAKTRAVVEQNETDYTTILPHKTVATRAGLGWIGKSALLITEQYGSMIRISSVLTNAPLETSSPVNSSKCSDCKICTNTCPANAIKGLNWSSEKKRDEIYDAKLCQAAARQRAKKSFDIEITLCGKCIEVCPYTQRYLNSEQAAAPL